MMANCKLVSEALADDSQEFNPTLSKQANKHNFLYLMLLLPNAARGQIALLV